MMMIKIIVFSQGKRVFTIDQELTKILANYKTLEDFRINVCTSKHVPLLVCSVLLLSLSSHVYMYVLMYCIIVFTLALILEYNDYYSKGCGATDTSACPLCCGVHVLLLW